MREGGRTTEARHIDAIASLDCGNDAVRRGTHDERGDESVTHFEYRNVVGKASKVIKWVS